MKFPKLHLVCSNDELRPQMMCIAVNKEYTFASDARIMVRHKTSEIFKSDFIESLPEQTILIPRKAIFYACQKGTTKVALSDDKKSFELHRLDGSIISSKLFTDREYPNANSIIPNPKDCQPLSKIGLNTVLLDRLSDGMGCDIPILHLLFFADNRAIYVTSNHSDYESAIGIIMPVNIYL